MSLVIREGICGSFSLIFEGKGSDHAFSIVSLTHARSRRCQDQNQKMKPSRIKHIHAKGMWGSLLPEDEMLNIN